MWAKFGLLRGRTEPRPEQPISSLDLICPRQNTTCLLQHCLTYTEWEIIAYPIIRSNTVSPALFKHVTHCLYVRIAVFGERIDKHAMDSSAFDGETQALYN